MRIILRLICEILSGKAVKIRLSMVCMEQRHLWQLSRHDIYARALEKLLQLFCI